MNETIFGIIWGICILILLYIILYSIFNSIERDKRQKKFMENMNKYDKK